MQNITVGQLRVESLYTGVLDINGHDLTVSGGTGVESLFKFDRGFIDLDDANSDLIIIGNTTNVTSEWFVGDNACQFIGGENPGTITLKGNLLMEILGDGHKFSAVKWRVGDTEGSTTANLYFKGTNDWNFQVGGDLDVNERGIFYWDAVGTNYIDKADGSSNFITNYGYIVVADHAGSTATCEMRILNDSEFAGLQIGSGGTTINDPASNAYSIYQVDGFTYFKNGATVNLPDGYYQEDGLFGLVQGMVQTSPVKWGAEVSVYGTMNFTGGTLKLRDPEQGGRSYLDYTLGIYDGDLLLTSTSVLIQIDADDVQYDYIWCEGTVAIDGGTLRMGLVAPAS